MSTLPTIDELKATLAAREHHIRESWVRAMELRIVREEMNKCQRAEGVNHYVACKEFSERYLGMLKDSKVTGYKQIDLE